MKRRFHTLPVALLASCLLVSAHAQDGVSAAPSSAPSLSMEILSDTKGADLRPYASNVLAEVRKAWLSHVAESDLKSLSETSVRLTLAPSGELTAVQLEHPIQNASLDRAAWNAILNTHYAPLPVGVRDADLKLRIFFRSR